MNWILIFCTFITLFFIYKITLDWSSISRISMTIWAILIIGCIILLPNMLYGNGIIFLLSAIIIFSIGENIGRKDKDITSSEVDLYNNPVKRRSWILLLLIIMLGIFKTVRDIYLNGFSIKAFFNIGSFLNMNTSMAYNRYYTNNSNSSVISAILTSFMYVSPLCGGYLFFYSKTRFQKVVSIISIIPGLLSLLFQNTKSGLIDSVMLFIIGLILSYICVYKKTFKLKKKYIIVGLISILILFSFLFFSMCARIGNFKASTINIVKRKFGTYAFGSVQAFDVWFTKNAFEIKLSDLMLGMNFFMAPFDVLEIYIRVQGVYNFINETISNVFTIYRGLIMDFGIIGSLIFNFILGYLGGMSLRKIKINSRNIIYRTIYVFVAFTAFRSYLISPWIYTSFCLMMIEFVIFLYIIRIPKKSLYE